MSCRCSWRSDTSDQAHYDAVRKPFDMVHEIVWTLTDIPEQLCCLSVLKVMVAAFAERFVEEFMVQASASSPSSVGIQKHEMVVVED